MPLNSQGTIQVFSDAANAAVYAYAQQDTGVFLREIPSGGTELELPADPNDGDWYEFADADGTCSSTHPIVLTAGEGATIGGASSLTFTSAFAGGMVRYSSAASNWILVAEAGAGDAIQSITSYNSTGGQAVTTAYVAVAGCIATLKITSTEQTVSFTANLGAVGSGSESAGSLSFRAVLDPAGADTIVGFATNTFAADAVVCNAGAIGGVLTDLSVGTHTLELQVICSEASAMIVGLQSSGQPNAQMTVQVSG